MLRKLRIAISTFFFVSLTFYLLDFADILPSKFHILAHIQLLPALFALNIGIVLFLIILTIVLGRVYCSSICPLGYFQDIINYITIKFQKKEKFSYQKSLNLLRWGVFSLSVIAFLFGFTFLIGLLDPYSAYSRMVVHILKPAYMAGNNLIETIFTQFNNYTFYKVSIYLLSVFSLIISLITLVVVGILAVVNGRIYCNTICPVGTLLGWISKYSILKILIDKNKCNSCGLCGINCKASCIDSKNNAIDYSRCINCFNCIDVCNKNAMSFRYSSVQKQQEDIDAAKRNFLLALTATSFSVGKVFAGTNGIKPNLLNKEKREIAISPPGSLSHENLIRKCTSCHLCVSKCPSNVIKPAFLEYGIAGIMQPILSFEKGFCNYDCTVCSTVCPSGAITSIDKNKKHHTQIGRVQLIIEKCIVYTDKTHCGACSEHCPTQAVSMVPYKNGLTIPQIDVSICVGCGGCEYICPSKPYKAIYVEGVEKHEIITIEKEVIQELIKVDDFGF
jgi:ferredoxin